MGLLGAAVLLVGAFGSPADGDGGRALPPRTPKLPLFWAEGVPQTDLDTYRQLGFNCLFCKARADFEESDWEELDQELAAAQEKGLWVVIEIETSLRSAYPRGNASPCNPAYLDGLRELTAEIVRKYKTLPNLLGWSAESGLEDLLSFSEADLSLFLSELGSSEPVMPMPAVTTEEPVVGRKAMLEGLYRFSAVRAVMQAQADFILQEDASHFLFSGQQRSLRSIATVSRAYDFVVSAMGERLPSGWSGLPERPAATTLGIELARGSGSRAGVLAFLDVYPQREPTSLEAEIKRAFLHGARGVGISNWAVLRDSAPLQQAFRSATSQVQEQGLDDFRPGGKTAIIYSPFAGGPQPQEGEVPSALHDTHPNLSGYIPGWKWKEPAELLLAFASGSGYGTVDYVAEDVLSTLPLDRYEVVLAPSVLYVSAATADWLRKFVLRGGILVADLGFGAYQSGSFNRLPAGLDRTVFGITALRVASAGGANLTFTGREAVAPSILPGEATGWEGNPAFIGPVAEASITPSTRPWALLRPFPRTLSRTARAGLLVHPWGKGTAIFATLHLWGEWPRLARSDPSFFKLHNDLIGRGAWAQLLGEPLLTERWEFLTAENEIGIMNLSEEERTVRIHLPLSPDALFGPGVRNLLGPEGAPRELELTVGGGEVARAARTPIVASVNCPTAIAVEELAGERVTLQVDPIGTGQSVGLSLTFGNGDYEISPWSRHKLTLQEAGHQETWLLRADGERKVTFSARIGSGRIILEPIASSAS